jgi:hypothetical protein
VLYSSYERQHSNTSPVVGHYNEDLKVGPKTDKIIYPHLGELLIHGYNSQRDAYELEIFGGAYGGTTLILSKNNVFIKPLEFEHQNTNFSILAKETPEQDNIIINLQQL